MTFFAMCRRTVCCHLPAAVLLRRHCFEVVWVDAAGNAAQVIDFVGWWDRTLCEFVGFAMRAAWFAALNVHLCIAVFTDEQVPNPAPAIGFWNRDRPHPIKGDWGSVMARFAPMLCFSHIASPVSGVVRLGAVLKHCVEPILCHNDGAMSCAV